jgi:hypothetical protein
MIPRFRALVAPVSSSNGDGTTGGHRRTGLERPSPVEAMLPDLARFTRTGW